MHIDIKNSFFAKKINGLFVALDILVFNLLLLEMFLGGSGRFTEVTPFLTLRMLLYFLCIFLFTVKILIIKKININTLLLVAVYVSMLIFFSMLGIINQAPDGFVFQDIKPLSYFLIILYFITRIKDNVKVELVVSLIKKSTVVLATLHICMGLIVVFNIFSHDQLWYFFNVFLTNSDPLDPIISPEVFFKGGYGFIYYKGDFYLCVGFIFWERLTLSNKSKIFSVFILSIAIILTGTRGFILMLLVSYLSFFLFTKANIIKVLNSKTLFVTIVIAICCLSIVTYFTISEFEKYIGDKQESDAIRYMQTNEVIERINPLSTLIGHGFGIGVPIRPGHMEIAYLEIFHKQGVLGLLLWLGLLVYIGYIYTNSNRDKNKQAFWIACLFTYLLSITNPYVNHPLGLSLLALSIVCINVKRDDNSKVLDINNSL